MRIGVFGGTFDPVHLGHLILAEQCREEARLDRVAFVPAARPPHKLHRPVTPFSHRVEMLNLAIAGHSAFIVDELEKERAGPSFTVDTLEEFHRRDRTAELVLLVGSDCLGDLPSWRDPVRIGQLAELLVMRRAGWSVETLEKLRVDGQFPPDLRLLTLTGAPMIDLSSRDLRERAAKGRSLRFLVPRAVECYIQTHRLYEAEAAGADDSQGAG
jgi:nicotinate-nucleotide adenylyltransferase